MYEFEKKPCKKKQGIPCPCRIVQRLKKEDLSRPYGGDELKLLFPNGLSTSRWKFPPYSQGNGQIANPIVSSYEVSQISDGTKYAAHFTWGGISAYAGSLNKKTNKVTVTINTQRSQKPHFTVRTVGDADTVSQTGTPDDNIRARSVHSDGVWHGKMNNIGGFIEELYESIPHASQDPGIVQKVCDSLNATYNSPSLEQDTNELKNAMVREIQATSPGMQVNVEFAERR